MMQGSQSQTLDDAFRALEQYTRGDNPEVLAPIEQAVQEAHGDPAARSALEERLAAQLRAPFSQVAQVFACRQLAIIGSASAVPAVAALLPDEDLSHMARYALERIPGPEADEALRDAVGKTQGTTKVGVINSVAVRRDARSVSLLAPLLTDEEAVAVAAAKALGEIGTPEAADALEAAHDKGTPAQRLAVADALLICAERLVASGEREQAVELLEALTTPQQASHVRLAASRARSAATRR